jgi:methionyl-tRNA synthetase
MMSKKPFYITTPIFYPSDKLHIGHAYCTSVADTIARYKRLMDFDVLFLTGSDEHGQKIERKAKENGITPIAYVDKIVASFQLLWKKLNISNDDFIRTTEERHRKVVQAIFQKIYDQGDIYKSAYEGWYCTPCETFWLERQLVDGKCPDCKRAVEVLKEESYFFRMGKYQERLLAFIMDHPDFIQPVTRRNEMINFIKGGLEDLCVSRTTFDWGIPVPFDSKHVVYVWFDALVNYITAAGYLDDRQKYEKYWPADLHLVGKEIVRFHSIIWPTILMALGEPLPLQVYGHGWLIVEGDKMSKSKGNVVDPLALIEEFGPDAIRYFLLREINLGLDGNFSRQALINRINADLANDLGNLLHRTLTMIGRFNSGVIHAPAAKAPVDEELVSLCRETVAKYQESMDKLDITTALKTVWILISRTNKYIDETAPWALAKQTDQVGRLDTVLYNLAETLRIVAILLSPAMPTTADKIWAQLGIAVKLSDVRLGDGGLFGGLVAGTKVNKPEQIFPRIDEQEISTEGEAVASAAVPKFETLPEISIDDFAKMDLRVVKVLAAEKVRKADKLLKLEVDLGGEVRTIVSGIAKHYLPEDLVGQSVVMIVNLKPATIRGIESRGMVLAASGDDKLTVVTVPDMPAGSKVK